MRDNAIHRLFIEVPEAGVQVASDRREVARGPQREHMRSRFPERLSLIVRYERADALAGGNG